MLCAPNEIKEPEPENPGSGLIVYLHPSSIMVSDHLPSDVTWRSQFLVLTKRIVASGNDVHTCNIHVNVCIAHHNHLAIVDTHVRQDMYY